MSKTYDIPRILISVSGGVVTGVLCDVDAAVEVFDFDNAKDVDDNVDELEERWDVEAKSMKEVL